MHGKIDECDYVSPANRSIYSQINIPFKERLHKVRLPENRILAVKTLVALAWRGGYFQPKKVIASGEAEEQGVSYVNVKNRLLLKGGQYE